MQVDAISVVNTQAAVARVGPGHASHRVRLACAAMALVVALPVVAACADDDADDTTADDGAPAVSETVEANGDTGATDGVVLDEVDQTVEAVISSVESQLGEVGPDGEVVYGWNHLVGDGTGVGALGEGTVGVDMLGNVHYTDGSGDFFGFITFDFGGGDTLAVRMNGHATAATDTAGAAFEADLEVIGGTGSLEDTAGVGRFEGGRPERLGSAVEGTYSFDLD